MNPKIYVGTYAKYNNGSIGGAWLCLQDYADIEEFYDAARELHADEDDPELMFQDWEEIPKAWVSETFVNDLVWDLVSLSDDDQSAVTEYLDAMGDADIEDILDRHISSYSGSKRDWLEQHLEDTGFFHGWTDDAINYFNVEAYLRDCEIDSYTFTDNHVFHQ